MVFFNFFHVIGVPDHFWFFDFSMEKIFGLGIFSENFGLVDHL